MANLWADSLKGCAPTDVEAGFKRWFATSKFFPKPAEIAEAGAEAIKQAKHDERMKAQRLALPPAPDPEHAARNLRGIQRIRNMLASKNITPESTRHRRAHLQGQQ